MVLFLCYASMEASGLLNTNVLTGCRGQSPKSAVCSRRSLKLVWIFTRNECEGQGAGDTFSKPRESWRLCIPCAALWRRHTSADISLKTPTISKSRGEYLVLHALLDVLVVPSQLWILRVRVSLLTDWQTTFKRRHFHLTHKSRKELRRHHHSYSASDSKTNQDTKKKAANDGLTDAQRLKELLNSTNLLRWEQSTSLPPAGIILPLLVQDEGHVDWNRACPRQVGLHVQGET